MTLPPCYVPVNTPHIRFYSFFIWKLEFQYIRRLLSTRTGMIRTIENAAKTEILKTLSKVEFFVNEGLLFTIWRQKHHVKDRKGHFRKDDALQDKSL